MIEKKQLLSIITEHDRVLMLYAVDLLRNLDGSNPVTETLVVDLLKGNLFPIKLKYLLEYVKHADNLDSAHNRTISGIAEKQTSFVNFMNELILGQSRQVAFMPLIKSVEKSSSSERYVSGAILACFEFEDAVLMLERGFPKFDENLRLLILIILSNNWNARLNNIFIKALDDTNQLIVSVAILTMATRGISEGIPRFKKFLYSAFDKVAISAIKALIILNVPDALAELKLLYLKAHSDKVKASIATAIADISDPASLNFLVTLLDAPQSRVRANAVVALKTKGKELGALPIEIVAKIQNLLKDDDHRVRADAIQTMWELGIAHNILEIEQMLVSSKDVVRSTGAYLCGKLKLSQFLKDLKNLTADSSWKVRKMSALSLMSLGSEGETTLELLIKNGTPDQQVIAAFARGFSDSPSGLDALLSQSHSGTEMSELATKLMISLASS